MSHDCATPDEKARAMALEAAHDHTRRSAAAALAATYGEPNDVRRLVLADAHRRLCAVLGELARLRR